MGARVFVWLGGALFVAALGFCAYSFAVTWGEAAVGVEYGIARPFSAATFGPWGTAAVDAVLLSLFALHHSLFARERVKRAMTRLVPDVLVRSVYVWVASLLLILVCWSWRPIGGDFYDFPGIFALPFLAIQAIGLWMTVRGVARIDPLELAGIHPPRESGGLQVNGPFRWVRHPLYLGWVLMVFGTAHMTRDRLTFAVVTTVYLVLAIPLEERSLRRSFGDDYVRYMRDVRWRIIPFIY
jgi:methanethiol S-methyltransferase